MTVSNSPEQPQQSYQQPSYQQPSYQQPSYQQPANPQVTYVTHFNAPPRTNTLAVVGFILSLLGFNVISLILCHIALGQIKRTGESGKGLALAGVIISWIAIGFALLMLVLWIVIVLIAVGSGTYNGY